MIETVQDFERSRPELAAGTRIVPEQIFRWLPSGRFQPHRFRPGGIGNWSGHLPFASDLVESLRPDVIVELGTHYGESYFGLCQAVQEQKLSTRCYAVDTWSGEQHAGFYTEDVFLEVNAYNDQHYRAFSQLLRTTFDEARQNFSHESIDLLHIDGLHTYQAVQHDFENWVSAVKPGGIVLIHDIVARHGDFGVWKLWEELSHRGRAFNFTHSWGLGVWQKPGPSTAPVFETLFESSASVKDFVRNFYYLCSRSLDLDQKQDSLREGADGKSLVQIYPQRQNGFSSACVFEKFVTVGDWSHVLFDVPSGTDAGMLRLDISESTGVIDLAAVRVSKVSDGSTILNLAGSEHLNQIKTDGTMSRLSKSACTEFARFISSGNDPQLYVSLDRDLADQPLIVELWLRVNTDVTALLPWLTSALADQDLKKGLEVQNVDLSRQLLDRTSQNDTAQREVLKLTDQLREEQAKLAQLTVRHEKLQKDAEDSSLTLERTQRQVYSVRKELASVAEQRNVEQRLMKQVQDDIRIEREKLEELQARLQNEQERTESLLTAKQRLESLEAEESFQSEQRLEAQQQLESLRVSHDELKREIANVLTSHSWKVTRPIRRIFENTRRITARVT